MCENENVRLENDKLSDVAGGDMTINIGSDAAFGSFNAVDQHTEETTHNEQNVFKFDLKAKLDAKLDAKISDKAFETVGKTVENVANSKSSPLSRIL